MTRRVALRAPAKINLGLEVLGKRPDGYHELDTVLMGLDLGDELTLEGGVSEHDELVVSGPASAGVPRDRTNLVLRALGVVRAIARAAGRPAPGLRVRLTKHIPAEAGLGGGSTDAAAAVLGASLLFGLDPERPEVVSALGELGSDCPFFLLARSSGVARCTGRGECVEPLPALALPGALAVFTPGFGCATAAVYAALDARHAVPATPAAKRQTPSRPVSLHAGLRNDLEPAAERSHPALASLRARLEELYPGTFRLAGSGSSCFGFFPDARAAGAALERLALDEEARRFGFRGRWVLPASSRGLRAFDS